MSYIRSLINVLEDKDKSLAARLVDIEKKARKLLIYTAGKFPYYTPHDFSHSENVLENLNWIIDDDIKNTLNKYELFFLIIAAWYHDWGMIGRAGEDPEIIRAEHHIRTEQFFEELYKEVYLEMQEAIVIGKICRGHRIEDLNGEYYKDVMFGSGNNIKTRLLASCLRLADECDITANRTPEVIFYSLKPKGDSEIEFKKHLHVGGIGRPISARHKIRISGIAWDPIGVLVLEKVQEKVQRELNGIKYILTENSILIDTVDLEVDTRGFINKPIEFSLNKHNIVDILIGSHLYSRSDAGIRELLQNSIDSCRLKKILISEYNPKIVVTISKDEIIIADNGMGMNYNDVVNFLSHKGVTFYESEEFKKIIKGKIFNPISKFGIGILSCFMIASNLEIETKKQNHQACRFIIHDLSERWRYEEGTTSEEGTKITLLLKENEKILNILNSIKHYIKCVEVPIFIIDKINNTEFPLVQEWGEEMLEVTNQIKILNNNITDINYLIDSKLIIKDDNLEVTYIKFINEDDIRMNDNNCFLSYKGIYVGNFDFFMNISNDWLMLINYNNDHLDLHVSRENYIINDNFIKFLDELHSNFLIYINKMVDKKTTGNDSLEKYNVFYKLVNSYLPTIPISNIKDLRLKIYSYIYNKTQFPVLTYNGLKFLNFSEIKIEGINSLIDIQLYTKRPHEHFSFINSLLVHSLKKNQGILFSPEDHNDLHFYNGEKNLSLLHYIYESQGVTINEMDQIDLVDQLNLKKIDTPLYKILPNFVSFVEMPIELRGSTACADRFEYQSEKRRGASGWEASVLILSELFGFNAEIQEIVNPKSKVKKLKEGKIYLDANDSFSVLLLANADKILSNDQLIELTRLYYYCYIVSDQFSYFAALPYEFLSIVIYLENVLLNFIGVESIPIITKRRGKLWGLLSNFWVSKPVTITPIQESPD